MFRLLLLFPFSFLLSCAPQTEKSTPNPKTMEAKLYPTTGSVERLDPAINQLISENAAIEILAKGHTWTEGPLWIEEGQYLLYSDIPPNSIFKWSEKGGKELYLKPSGYTGDTPRGGEPGSNALLLDSNGALVLCQHGDRRMARMTSQISDPKPLFKTIIDRFEGKRFNSPNDAIFDSQGNMYFTDPPYGLEGNVDDPTKEVDFQGVYRLNTEGNLEVIDKDMARPNGIALSPDEKTLYVANSQFPPNYMQFDLSGDGQVVNRKEFHLTSYDIGKGAPDGMKVDKNGIIWATGPGGVLVFQPDGKLLGRIKTGEATSNCAFNADESVLFMTCDDYLMRIKLKA